MHAMKIEKHSFEVPVFVSHLEQHEELKRELLELIDSLDAQEIKATGSPIAKSSYGQAQLNQLWEPLFLEMAMPHLRELFNQLFADGGTVKRHGQHVLFGVAIVIQRQFSDLTHRRGLPRRY